MVREGTGERTELHIFDAWQHCATVDPLQCDVPLSELAYSARARRREFDLDDYRILTRLLRQARYRVQPLPRE